MRASDLRPILRMVKEFNVHRAIGQSHCRHRCLGQIKQALLARVLQCGREGQGVSPLRVLYMCIYIHMCVCVCVCVCVCTWTYVYAYAYESRGVGEYVSVCVYLCMYVCMYVCIHTNTHTRIYLRRVYMYIYRYSHRYTSRYT